MVWRLLLLAGNAFSAGIFAVGIAVLLALPVMRWLSDYTYLPWLAAAAFLVGASYGAYPLVRRKQSAKG